MLFLGLSRIGQRSPPTDPKETRPRCPPAPNGSKGGCSASWSATPSACRTSSSRRAASRPPPEIEFEPPNGYPRAHAGVPPGTYSDDGAQALCLLASLLHCGKLDPDDLARRLLDWYELPGISPSILGSSTWGFRPARRSARSKAGTPALEAGPADERANGNGSLMRVLPLALWHKGSDAELVEDACAQSVITHGHVRSQLCCALYCLWARRTLDEAPDPWGAAVVSLLREVLADDPEGLDELETPRSAPTTRLSRPAGVTSSTACLSARWATSAGTFEQVVKVAVALGHDTDTTAAVAGGDRRTPRRPVFAIPSRWLDALRGREHFEPLLKALVIHAA